jgi:16S rRNA (guanine527-N7)-methyltransferase
VDSARIAELLAPLVTGLAENQLSQLATYLDLLLRWNARMNLTAARDPEHIVTRHFGESLFAASRLVAAADAISTIDLGAGAGFPGLPLKIYAPKTQLTLIESQQRKATFLREVVRALGLDGVTVFSARAETYPHTAALVTLRAVERFEKALPLAANLVAPGGRLALLIGENQVNSAHQGLPDLKWQAPVPMPQSSARVLLIGLKRE